ncbi:hypothetical protein BRD56_10865 [Thermoplasmatales archaeon SW_10_69_26]|nr:MAG: hypothetical protein BRD56_10865 [Thermoplasmatales archaeon SW_10_69_26]
MDDHPPDPDPSAVVILRRPDGEIYLVRRPRSASFFPGFHAFPGGGVEPEDEAEDQLATLRACAARELREETRVEVSPDELAPAGVVVTPPFSPIRYRTQFFLADVDAACEPEPSEPELAGGSWTTPAAAIEGWEAGEVKLPPPVIHTLELLADDGPQAVRARGTEVDSFPITFLPGLRVEPLETSTLPPHTHTNAFVVGEDELAVVDPGAGPPELDPLLDALDALETDAEDLAYVALTHHHGDHVGGVQALLEEFDAELACSPATAERIEPEADVLLAEGDELDLGEHALVALETPGHAPGHLAFHVPQARAVLPGDLVAGIGTVLVDPDEGDMAAYMDSLARMADLCEDEGVRLAFPAHGPPVFGPGQTFRDTLEHRREREVEVLDAVEAGARQLPAIARRAYEDKPKAPTQLTHASTRAHLAKLVDDGAVTVDGDRWEPG